MNSSVRSLRVNGAPPLAASRVVPVPTQQSLPAASMSLMLVTPEQAKAWLEAANIDNRRLRENTWMKYACDMLDGKWIPTTDAIGFDRNGRLVNGQHRLRACVESGAAFRTLVAFGLDPASFHVTDGGQGRTTADAVRNLPNANYVSAIAKLAWIHEKHGIDKLNNSRVHPTRAQEVEFIRSNEARLVEAAHRTVGPLVRRLVAPRIWGFCWYAFSADNAELTERFMSELKVGANISTDSSVYWLRERLQSNANGKSKLQALDVIALFFKAWIAYRDGKRVRCLRWRTDGPNPEAFPQLRRQAVR